MSDQMEIDSERAQERLVEDILSQLASCGVIDICVCAGSRNALFVQKLSCDGRFSVHWWPEERSAAFYALGIAKSTGNPTAVVTTSGTAAAELLPAVMEAHYS